MRYNLAIIAVLALCLSACSRPASYSIATPPVNTVITGRCGDEVHSLRVASRTAQAIRLEWDGGSVVLPPWAYPTNIYSERTSGRGTRIVRQLIAGSADRIASLEPGKTYGAAYRIASGGVNEIILDDIRVVSVSRELTDNFGEIDVVAIEHRSRVMGGAEQVSVAKYAPSIQAVVSSVTRYKSSNSAEFTSTECTLVSIERGEG